MTVSQPRFKEGDFVKIRRRGEGFWCQILSCAGKALDVRVENDLLRSPELPLGSALRILESDVEQVMTTVDEAEFRELFRTCLRASIGHCCPIHSCDHASSHPSMPMPDMDASASTVSSLSRII